jgi:thiol-disulfide isomerase/thioredoxin
MNFCARRYGFLLYLFIVSVASYASLSNAAANERGGPTHTAMKGSEVIVGKRWGGKRGGVVGKGARTGVAQPEINGVMIDDLIETSTLLVIDFFTPICGPCNELKPIFKKLAREFRSYADFIMIDERKSSWYVESFGITGFPTGSLSFHAGKC